VARAAVVAAGGGRRKGSRAAGGWAAVGEPLRPLSAVAGVLSNLLLNTGSEANRTAASSSLRAWSRKGYDEGKRGARVSRHKKTPQARFHCLPLCAHELRECRSCCFGVMACSRTMAGKWQTICAPAEVQEATHLNGSWSEICLSNQPKGTASPPPLAHL
jgi:hypothetical protein